MCIIKAYSISLSITFVLSFFELSGQQVAGYPVASQTLLFTDQWEFTLLERADDALQPGLSFRDVDLPHDWGIEGEFSERHPAGYNGGALPGGIGLYQKTFRIPESDSAMYFFIRFDGVYMNSDVWINGHYLGNRPYGYIGFEYDLTPYLKYGAEDNILRVRADNSLQPNSRWYSGSGIYRNVYLIKKDEVYIDRWGVFVTTPKVTDEVALVVVETSITNRKRAIAKVGLVQLLGDRDNIVADAETIVELAPGESKTVKQEFRVSSPVRWDLENPHLYQLYTQIVEQGNIADQETTSVGFRTFRFDLHNGFFLNGKHVKIRGVCNHHDLGPLGAAVNKSALERQLRIMEEMGVNAIRTAHNPPAPEFLQLCDEMGILVMDEAFDVWKIGKTTYGYQDFWDEWHERDLRDFMRRDRNHPGIVIWSVGNEIMEQWDSTGMEMVREIVGIARSMDSTRPITTANNPPLPSNCLNIPDVVDVIGYNYAHRDYHKHFETFPHRPFLATETTSALATRGYYDRKSDTLKRWPVRWDIPFTGGNPGNTISAYDQVSTPWGSTHEESWKVIKQFPFMSGMFVWTGFDYLGEPTPYTWPSRSSYFGIVDLAGFPKDAYYMYQSEWTDKPVLHVLPHWTWKDREEVDVWAYYAQAEEVELFLNGKSLGTKRKEGDDLHVMWRVKYTPGELRAVSYKNGKEVRSRTIRTAGPPSRIRLEPDRRFVHAAENELAFITVTILDTEGNPVPEASSLVRFEVGGPGRIRAVCNGDQTSHASFLAGEREAFSGKCLAIVEPTGKSGIITVIATSEGLDSARIQVVTK